MSNDRREGSSLTDRIYKLTGTAFLTAGTALFATGLTSPSLWYNFFGGENIEDIYRISTNLTTGGGYFMVSGGLLCIADAVLKNKRHTGRRS